MFVTSIAVTGFLHQVAWLWDEPFVKSNWDKLITSGYMVDIGTALRSYQAEHGRFPKSTGTVLNSRRGEKSYFFKKLVPKPVPTEEGS